MTYREGEADAACRMPDLTAPPGAQHQAQHARNISVHSDSSSFVRDPQDGNAGGECNPPKQTGVIAEMRHDSPQFVNAPGRTRTSDLRFRKPSLYPLSYGRKSFE